MCFAQTESPAILVEVIMKHATSYNQSKAEKGRNSSRASGYITSGMTYFLLYLFRIMLLTSFIHGEFIAGGVPH